MNNKLINNIKNILIAPLILAVLICILSKDFVYDEPYYFLNLELLQKFGLGVSFIQNLAGPAGPLHAILYYYINIFVSTKSVYLFRIIGLFFGLLAIGCVYFTQINKLKIGKECLLILACPVFYVCSGLALTENPALLFFCAGIFFLSKTQSIEGNYLHSILSGILISIAICGRQPFLMIVPAILISWIYVSLKSQPDAFKPSKLIKTLLFCFFALVIPSILFYIWGGIAPKVGGDIATQKPYSIENGLLGLGYFVIICFLMYPHYIFNIISNNYKPILCTFFLIVCINFFFIKVEFQFINSIAIKFIPRYLFQLYGYVCFSILMTLSIFSIILVKNMLKLCENNMFKTCCLICIVLIIITCFKVTHQFSSRYVYQAIFMLPVVMKGCMTKDKASIAINFTGAFIGLMSFMSYLHINIF